MIRAASLEGLPVLAETGDRLGRVREIHMKDGEVTALTCGGLGFLQRFLPVRRGHRVEWRQVRQVTASAVIVERARHR
jgi:sporulation protein YlmC with PRC-barrel domain